MARSAGDLAVKAGGADDKAAPEPRPAAAVAAATSSDKSQKPEKRQIKLPEAAADASSSSQKIHGDDAGGTTQLMSREESENYIALMRTNVANLAREFQVLNQAAQVKFNSYMEAATALKDAEQLGLVAYLVQLERTREHDLKVAETGAVFDAERVKNCNDRAMHRHNQILKRSGDASDAEDTSASKKSKRNTRP